MESDSIFLLYVLKALCKHPEDIRIERTQDDMGVLLSVHVHKEDMGNVIGRSGQTAKAIRTVLRVVGMKNNARISLRIEEPMLSERADDDFNKVDAREAFAGIQA